MVSSFLAPCLCFVSQAGTSLNIDFNSDSEEGGGGGDLDDLIGCGTSGLTLARLSSLTSAGTQGDEEHSPVAGDDLAALAGVCL